MAKSNNPLQPLLDQLPKPLRNKYFLVLVVFFAWMFFVDTHDIMTVVGLQQTVNKLEEDKTYYQQKLEDAKQERLDLEENKEKFARERYYMQKSNEDVYIIVEEEN